MELQTPQPAALAHASDSLCANTMLLMSSMLMGVDINRPYLFKGSPPYVENQKESSIHTSTLPILRFRAHTS
jgi:hypothetical protein